MSTEMINAIHNLANHMNSLWDLRKDLLCFPKDYSKPIDSKKVSALTIAINLLEEETIPFLRNIHILRNIHK